MTGWWNQLFAHRTRRGSVGSAVRWLRAMLHDQAGGRGYGRSALHRRRLRYLDLDLQRCKRYPQRHELVPDCVPFSAQEASKFAWLPESCAYRKRANGLPLAWWHPLESGDPQTVVDAGISVRGRVRSEATVAEDELQAHIVRWVQPESNT